VAFKKEKRNMKMKTGSTILITGATGMIGGCLVREILKKDLCGHLVLPVRDAARAAQIYSGLASQDGEKLCFVRTCAEDICPEQFPMPIDYMIHCACITQSSEMITHPAETADSIVIGTRNVLELARVKQVKSMVYVSSMEVYGKVPDSGETTGEEHLGELDLFSVRSCYPVAKRMAEHYCYLYQKEYGIPVKISRLAQTFGKGVRQDDNRVYMQFARSVRDGKDIVLHTEGLSVGNYCHLQDTVAGILCILYRGIDGEAYNVVNEKNTMTIREMAHLVADRLADGRIKVVYQPDKDGQHGYAADTGLRLSASKLRGLGWKPEKSLIEMYREVLEEIQ